MILRNVKIAKEFFDVEISGSKIASISAHNSIKNPDVLDCSGLTLVPAFVEMHCHLREPGYENKETIKSGSLAAIKGGYCAICPMPNTNPITDNVSRLALVLSKSQAVKLFPICSVTNERGELSDLVELKKHGAVAFSDDGQPFSNLNLLEAALKIAKSHDLLIISHAEDTKFSPNDNRSEYEAVAREIELVRKIGVRYHFAHISTKESVELIRQAKQAGLAITCETAPHYFTLSKDDIVNNQARFKMNPPLREKADVAAVIEGLKDGTIDVIATDHAPHTMEEKTTDFERAPMGIVGFETAFSLGYSKLVKANHLSLAELIEKMSSNPAKILGLSEYGRIEVGQVANLVLIDEAVEVVVDASGFKSKCKISPFDKMELYGKVSSTIIEGEFYGN